jgi:hypothetical protein
VDLHTIETGAIWAIVIIAVIGLVLAIVIKKIVGKIIALVVAAALIFFAWQQRDKVVQAADDVKGEACAAAPTFFGITVKLPDDWCKP